MKKNSLILEIKNDLNKIRKDLDVTLQKLAILESMIELEERLVTLQQPKVESTPVEEITKETVLEESTLVKESIEELASEESLSKDEIEKESVLEEIVQEEQVVQESVTEDPSAEEEVQEYRNLMTVIGLNDRFRFRHDLFSNSDDVFKETIQVLNTIEKFSQAVDFLNEKFEWDQEDATVVYFYDIIKPKFSK